MRTGEHVDYIKCDQFICDLHGNEELFKENLNILNHFDNYNIALQRNSADLTVNFYGQQLLDFCKYNNLFFINGRMSPDKQSPKTTCKDRSTIDYFISSVYNFPFIDSFEVIDFDSLFSDAHCGVKLSINVLTNGRKQKKRSTENVDLKPILWNEEKCHAFQENISENALSDIKSYLENLKQQNVSRENLNEIVTKIENLFTSTAKNTFGIKNKTMISLTKNGSTKSAERQEMYIIMLESCIIKIKLCISKIY